MLLAIDIGNTNIVLGIFEGRSLKGHWRLASDPTKTSDDYALLLPALLDAAGFATTQVDGVIISSVVPTLTSALETVSESRFHRPAVVVSCESPTGLTLRYRNPWEIGADRLVNAAAAYDRYRTALIIVDFGTATTFCTVTGSGDYLGGAIAPGIGISADALSSRTAKLPRVDVSRPKTVIGLDTVSSIQSGLVFGYAGMVDAMVLRIQGELGEQAKAIAMGGWASLIAPESSTIQEVRPFLTLEGLELIHRRTLGDA